MNTLPRTATALPPNFVGPFMYKERFYFYDNCEANYYDPILDIYSSHDECVEISEIYKDY